MSILDKILKHKRREVEQRKRQFALEQVKKVAHDAPSALDFTGHLRCVHAQGSPALIAEVKKRSPSKGELTSEFDPLHLVDLYSKNGAAAISILTDEKFFGGRLDYLRQLTQLYPRLPFLQKDFIIESYQVYEARAAGADAILLIVAGLSDRELSQLFTLTCDLGMDALLELHTIEEIDRALRLEPSLVGINNRDLKTFQVDIRTCLSLRSMIPEGVTIVAESGIHTVQDIEYIAEAGLHAILVGEALITAKDIAAKVSEFASVRPAYDSRIHSVLEGRA